MPFARIALHKGKSPEYLRALADNVYRALQEAYDVPANDRFVMIHQLEPWEFHYDRNYLSGPRSDDFVLIAITAGRPRDTPTKQAFYRRLVELLGESPGIAGEDVMVQVTTSSSEDWSFGGGRMGIFAKPAENG
ncbi:tautomerase family protein [Pseudomonas knackmussii]|uniref:tautomerase family protein n=1 Tax=Pseudomonas knackmussii TaxID=65741 RepID=UPI001362A365|nr:tautomerase family protein [Pseudomonas knackmussii]